MAYDPGPANDAARRSQELARQNIEGAQRPLHPPPPGSESRQGSPLGFLIVVGIIVAVALWIASMQ